MTKANTTTPLRLFLGLISFLILQGGILSAQPLPSTKDSLQALLATDISDSTRVVVLYKLFYKTMSLDLVEAGQYAQEALSIAERTGQPGLIGKGNNVMGLSNSRRGNYQIALEYFSRSIICYADAGKGWEKEATGPINNTGTTYYKMGNLEDASRTFDLYLLESTRVHDTMGIYKALNNKASALKEMGHFTDAVELYHQALELQKGKNDSIEMSRTYINLGSIYRKYGLLPEAREHLLRALKILEPTGNTYELLGIHSVLGSYYTQVDSLPQAEFHHRECLTLATGMGERFHMGASHDGLADILLQRGDLPGAEQEARTALGIYRTIGAKNSITNALNLMGTIHLGQNKADSALSEFEEAFRIGVEIRSPEDLNQSLQGLAAAWHKKGNDVKAFAYLSRQKELSDSLFSVEKHSQVLGMESRYESRLKQQEIDKLKLDKIEGELQNSRSRNAIYLLSAGIGLVVVVALAFAFLLMQRIRFGREIIRANEKIQQANEDLEKRVEERTMSLTLVNKELDTFLYEAAHALRRPMQRVRGLSSLIREAEAKPVPYWEMMDFTLESTDKMLRNLIEINEISSRNASREPVDVKSMSNEIFSELQPAGMSLEFQGSETTVIADPFMTKAVLRCLLENAILYRKQEGPPAVVSVKIEKRDAGFALTVRDNGRGIGEAQLPHIFEMFYRGTADPPGHGLGLYMAKKAAEKMGATLEANSREGEFTEISVHWNA